MKEYLGTYKKSLTDAIWAIEEPEFAKAVEILRQAWFHDKQVFIMGNGSGAGDTSTTFGAGEKGHAVRRRSRSSSIP